jgi:hypothetical protein
LAVVLFGVIAAPIDHRAKTPMRGGLHGGWLAGPELPNPVHRKEMLCGINFVPELSCGS